MPDDKSKNYKKNYPETIKIGTSNVRTLKGEDKLPKLLSEMVRLDIPILGVSETHWTNGIEEAFEEGKHVIFQSSRSDAIHRQGVAIFMIKEMAEYVIDCQL